MTCPVCGRYGAPDSETGYDVNTVCPGCARNGWTYARDGQLICDPGPTPLSVLEPTEEGDVPCPFGEWSPLTQHAIDEAAPARVTEREAEYDRITHGRYGALKGRQA